MKEMLYRRTKWTLRMYICIHIHVYVCGETEEELDRSIPHPLGFLEIEVNKKKQATLYLSVCNTIRTCKSISGNSDNKDIHI